MNTIVHVATRADLVARMVAGAHTDSRVVASTSVFLGTFLIVYVAIAVVSIIAAVNVVTKAGYSGWWVLLGLVPFVGFVMFLVFAFSKWPVRREVESLRAQLGGGYGRPPWGGGYSGGPGTGFGSGPMPTGNPSPWSGTTGPPPPWGGTTAPGYPGASGSGGWMESPEQELPPLPPFNEVVPIARVAPATEGTRDQPVSGAPTPAGWYPAPDGRQRYWDGTAWTDHYASERPDAP